MRLAGMKACGSAMYLSSVSAVQVTPLRFMAGGIAEIGEFASFAREETVQAWTHFIGAGVELVTGDAFLEASFAACRIAVGIDGPDQKGSQRRDGGCSLPNHALT